MGGRKGGRRGAARLAQGLHSRGHQVEAFKVAQDVGAHGVHLRAACRAQALSCPALPYPIRAAAGRGRPRGRARAAAALAAPRPPRRPPGAGAGRAGRWAWAGRHRQVADDHVPPAAALGRQRADDVRVGPDRAEDGHGHAALPRGTARAALGPPVHRPRSRRPAARRAACGAPRAAAPGGGPPSRQGCKAQGRCGRARWRAPPRLRQGLGRRPARRGGQAPGRARTNQLPLRETASWTSASLRSIA